MATYAQHADVAPKTSCSPWDSLSHFQWLMGTLRSRDIETKIIVNDQSRKRPPSAVTPGPLVSSQDLRSHSPY
jgi:hypothetical protein